MSAETPDAASAVAPYDALLLVSFGGPEGPDDVVPFLENVTRGRGIPRERLAEVGQHYSLFGGKSPINDQNREFLAALRADLAGAGIDLPVYWGNRNWDPYLTDTLAQMAADGVTRAACFVTSAYSSWSSCRQYRENLCDAAESLPGGVEAAPRLDKLRHYFNHPGFVEPVVDGVLAALADLPEEVRDGAHLAFVTHSIPDTMAETSGPRGRCLRRAAPRRRRHGGRPARRGDRSRPPARAGLLLALGRPARAVARARRQRPPRGAARGRRTGRGDGPGRDSSPTTWRSSTTSTPRRWRPPSGSACPARRSATAGNDPRFVAAVRDLLLERAAVERGEDVARAATGRLGPLWDACPGTCCPNPRGERPALCGA